jgi:GNAT superfamily N-acetyltransferase
MLPTKIGYAANADLDAVTLLLDAALQERHAADPDHEPPAPTFETIEEDVAEYHRHDRKVIVVAYERGLIARHVVGAALARLGNKRLILDAIATDPERRHQGIATGLIVVGIHRHLTYRRDLAVAKVSEYNVPMQMLLSGVGYWAGPTGPNGLIPFEYDFDADLVVRHQECLKRREVGFSY